MSDDLSSKTSVPTDNNEAESSQELDQLQLQIAELRASNSGPLPPPAAFRSYEEVMPGAAKPMKMTDETAPSVAGCLSRGTGIFG